MMKRYLLYSYIGDNSDKSSKYNFGGDKVWNTEF